MVPTQHESSNGKSGSGEQPAGGGFARLDQHLDAALTGKLPCVVCTYDLRGLSIRAVCPECGTAVRATILYTVDPEAEEFRPLNGRRLVAVSLVLWSVAALTASLFAWVPRIADLIGRSAIHTPETGWARSGLLICAAASGLAMIGLVRPIRSMPLRKSIFAFLALAAYAPLIWAMSRILYRIDPISGAPYIQSDPDPVRLSMRLLMGACLVTILLGFRPNARDLVRRSLAIRTGRVDRQTILAMVAAVLLAATGDALRLISIGLGPVEGSFVQVIGTFVVTVGSLFLTLGMLGAVIDCWRISRSILIPSPTLRQIIAREDEPTHPTTDPAI